MLSVMENSELNISQKLIKALQSIANGGPHPDASLNEEIWLELDEQLFLEYQELVVRLCLASHKNSPFILPYSHEGPSDDQPQ